MKITTTTQKTYEFEQELIKEILDIPDEETITWVDLSLDDNNSIQIVTSKNEE